MTGTPAIALAALLAAATTPEGLPVPPGWRVGSDPTNRIRVVHPPRAAHLVPRLEREAVAFDRHLRTVLGGRPHRTLTLYLAPSDAFLNDLDPFLRGRPEWAVGYALGQRGIAVLLGDPRASPFEVGLIAILRHELVHLVLAERFRGYAPDVPTWFSEGTCTYLSHEGSYRDITALALVALSQRVISLKELEMGFPAEGRAAGAAYVQSYAFVAHLVDSHGEEVIARIVNGVGGGEPFQVVFRDVTGRSVEEEEARWRRSFLWRYRWVPVLTSGTTLWAGVMALFLVAAWRRRRRSRDLMARWEEEEGDHLDPGQPVM